jgi:hypothetical protein
VSIVGVIGKSFYCYDDFLSFFSRGNQSYLIAEFVLFVRFAFSNTSGKGLVNAVNLVFVVFLLVNLQWQTSKTSKKSREG